MAAPRTARNGFGTLIESSLIAVQILVMGESVLREWVQERYEDEIERRAELKEKARLKKEADEQMERERIAKLERERVEQLVRDANSWRQATELRAYVKAVTDANASKQGGEAHGALDEWAGWALSVADKLDPLLRSRFEVSGENRAPPESWSVHLNQ